MNHTNLLRQAAKDTGYNDTMFDGINTSMLLDCRCDECLTAYEEGAKTAMDEMFKDRPAPDPESKE